MQSRLLCRIGERGSQRLDAGAVDAQVGVAESRGRSHVDESLSRDEQEFDIIDEAQPTGAIFGIQIIVALLNDPCERVDEATFFSADGAEPAVVARRPISIKSVSLRRPTTSSSFAITSKR